MNSSDQYLVFSKYLMVLVMALIFTARTFTGAVEYLLDKILVLVV